MKHFVVCAVCGHIELVESKIIATASYYLCEKCNDVTLHTPAKAISIKQPWAYLIASGIKDIENRTWKTNFRGRVSIHVGLKEAGLYSSLLTNSQLLSLPRHTLMCLKYSAPMVEIKSAIIGSVEIVDCVINHESIWAEKTEIIPYPLSGLPMYGKKIYNWILKDPILFEKPILNVKGKLSFFIPEITEL